jgi:uncharacterized protein YegJ (DUF2314 family)
VWANPKGGKNERVFVRTAKCGFKIDSRSPHLCFRDLASEKIPCPNLENPTMTEETQATNPVNVKPEFISMLRGELFTCLIIIALVSLIFVPLGWYVWNWLWLGLLLIPFGIWAVFYGTIRLMKMGACCPAKVLSLDPPRLAVFSDMSMREDASHPAIIVKEFSPRKLSGPPVKVGDRLVVAAFYAPGDEKLPEERWKNLSVIQPVRSVTSNPEDLRRTMESIDADEWKSLDAGALRAQSPYDELVYFLEAGRKDGGKGVTEGRVLLVPADDPEMEKVKSFGRKTFRFFLRELSWEKRRIIPGLDIAAVKIAFSDPPEYRSQNPGGLDVEYMWVSDVEFDGRQVSGQLLNEPDSIKSVRQGDPVTANPSQIVDWLYSVMGEVCGGFTIQEMRRKMDKRQLRQHDNAWGLEFGKPGVVRLVPDSYLPEQAQKKMVPLPELEGMFIQGDYKFIDSQEHPMSVNMRSTLEEALKKNPEFLDSTDSSGLSTLHQLTIAGSLDGVDVCLKHGADPNQVAANGMTPAKLAKGLGWKKVLERLKEAGAAV